MPAPKLKFHLLPAGYRESTDNDVQFAQDDEILPLLDKEIILANATLLTGIAQVTSVAAVPINTSSTRVIENLSPTNGLSQTATIAPTQMVNIPDQTSPYALLVLRADNSVVPTTDYTVTSVGITFNDAPTELRKISYFPKASTPRTTWALPFQSSYNGTNPTFNKVVVVVNGGSPILITPSGTNREYITTSSASTVVVSYWYMNAVSKNFCGPNANWVAEHMNTWPDVFVGVKDYPGDSGEINGQQVVQNEVPQYRDPGTYTPSYRDGLITFAEAIDSNATPVRANYAYLIGTHNVTSQKLDAVTGSSNKSFRATTEAVFPETHGLRIVTRSNNYMPFNVYIDGVQAPQRLSVTPYEVLTIKTGP